MPTCWVLLQDGCLLDCGHSISMPADRLSLNIACLLTLCFSICYTCWYGVSLSAVPADMVFHYQPCLLVWWLTIGHAFWYGASLWVMSSGVLPHYRPCLFAWYLTLGHACWSGLHFNRYFDWLSVEGRGMFTSLVLLLQRCHYIRHVCWSGATLRYAYLYSATLSDMHAWFIYSDTRVCKVLLHQARNLVSYKSTRHAHW